MVELNDEEHELILDNPEAEAFNAEQSIQWALARGWTRERAERAFLPKKREPAFDTSVLNRITNEVVMGLPPAVEDTPGMAELREKIAVDVAKAKEEGLVIDLVKE